MYCCWQGQQPNVFSPPKISASFEVYAILWIFLVPYLAVGQPFPLALHFLNRRTCSICTLSTHCYTPVISCLSQIFAIYGRHKFMKLLWTTIYRRRTQMKTEQVKRANLCGKCWLFGKLLHLVFRVILRDCGVQHCSSVSVCLNQHEECLKYRKYIKKGKGCLYLQDEVVNIQNSAYIYCYCCFKTAKLVFHSVSFCASTASYNLKNWNYTIKYQVVNSLIET